MSVLNKGTDFNTGDQVTATALDQLVDNGSFAAGAVDGVTTQLSGGAIIVRDLGISTGKLADGSVTTVKIADSNVTTAKIANSNVTADKLASDSVTTAKIENLAVTEAKLAANAVATAKIADGAVTLAKMANIATARLIGRNTSGTGVPEALDAAAGRTVLGVGSMATRALTISTSDPSGGSDGDVWFKYVP